MTASCSNKHAADPMTNFTPKAKAMKLAWPYQLPCLMVNFVRDLWPFFSPG